VEGFFIDSTGLQWSEQQGFGGWLGKHFHLRYPVTLCMWLIYPSVRLVPRRTPALLYLPLLRTQISPLLQHRQTPGRIYFVNRPEGADSGQRKMLPSEIRCAWRE
jgi:hypothetical protein